MCEVCVCEVRVRAYGGCCARGVCEACVKSVWV